jgi:hypothetical protein
MQFRKEHLDTPIWEIELGATNKETLREFIKNSEEEFGLIPKDLDNMTDEHLNRYLEFVDYLWEK